MTLPLATATCTVEREGPHEPYEKGVWRQVAARVRCVVSDPTAADQRAGGSEVVIDAVLLADPCDLVAGDRVRVSDGRVFRVQHVVRRPELVGHVKAGLLAVSGGRVA